MSVIVRVSDGFECKARSNASRLFMYTNFALYEKDFPQQYVDDTHESYPISNQSQLATELEIVHKRTDYRSVTTGAVDLLRFIVDNDSEHIFPETRKLIRITATVPTTSEGAERIFPSFRH